ncbi:MAG: chorismate--pyruvate lyase [Lachnoclostridium sp.]|nr:chorismate--pyruvate lyase [Lachnoclostridium sp.]
MDLKTYRYVVEKIDGDYAMLRNLEETDAAAEPKMVARALLPAEIREGTKLLYEYLQYSVIE